MATKVRKNTKAYKELMAGLPPKIDLVIDWREAQDKCDVNRRNCAIHLAMSSRDDITRVSVGVDEINFVWRGDARVGVSPSVELMAIILDNDRAAAGEADWPTGVQHVVLDLSDAYLKKDLRARRAELRKARHADLEKHNQGNREWRERLKSMDYQARAKKRVETERLRGRFA